MQNWRSKNQASPLQPQHHVQGTVTLQSLHLEQHKLLSPERGERACGFMCWYFFSSTLACTAECTLKGCRMKHDLSVCRRRWCSSRLPKCSVIPLGPMCLKETLFFQFPNCLFITEHGSCRSPDFLSGKLNPFKVQLLISQVLPTQG